MVAEKAAHIIFHDRIERTIERHEAAGSHEEVGPRKDADERIDGDLRGEGGEENRAGDGALRICIDQPCIHRRNGRIHGDADEDRPEGQVVCTRCQVHDETVSSTDLEEDAIEQKVSAQHVNHEVAVACAARGRGVVAPDEEEGCHRKTFPEGDEGHPVLSKSDSKRTSGVGHGGKGFDAAVIVAGVDPADAGHQSKDHAEDIA